MPTYGGAGSIKRLGDILNYGKLYLAGQVGVAQTAGSVSLDHEANTDIVLYHVYGDPTMAMWTSNPNRIFLPELVWEVKFSQSGGNCATRSRVHVITLLQDGLARRPWPGAGRQGTAKLRGRASTRSKPYELAAEVRRRGGQVAQDRRRHRQRHPQDGGSVQNGDGSVKIVFPPTVLPEPVTLLLGELGNPTIQVDTGWLLPAVKPTAPDIQASPHMTDVIIYRHFEAQAVGAAGNLVTQFDGDYAMDVAYSPDALAQDGLTSDDLYCIWLDEAEGKWKQIDHTVDAGAGRSSAGRITSPSSRWSAWTWWTRVPVAMMCSRSSCPSS